MKRRMLNSSLAVVIALTTVPFNIFPHVAKAAGTVESTVNLRLMETTDLHDNVMDYDYYKDAPTIEFGLDRTAQLIHQARAEVNQSNSMLFDAGDLLQGNPMADYVARVKKLGATEQHPMFKAMGMLGYDAGIVGNHEFNYGLDFLNNALEESPYNVVNANIYDAVTGKNYFQPYKIIDKKVIDDAGVEQTIKVGVIGFAPPQILQWDHDNLAGKVTVKGIVESAEEFIPKMRADGADVIVAIAHSGCDVAAPNQAEAENAVYALSSVPGIDALLFGHAHVNFPGDAKFNGNNTIDNVNGHINQVPAMEAGFWGNNLGVMDLNLQKADGKWQVASSKAALRPIFKKVPDANGKLVSVETVDGPDQQIVDAVKDYHQGTLDYVRGKIGTTSAPLYSFFAQVQDDPTIQIVNNAQTEYVKKAIADKPELKDLPVLSAGAPFKAGGRSGVSYYTNIPAGELSIKSANDLYLYPNTLKAVQVTGATVKEWLEMSAGQFFQVDPTKAEPQNIVNDDFPSYNFDVIDGVKYQIDLTQKPRYDKNGNLINPDSHRIVNLTMPDGTAVDPNQQFIVATNNYRAGGGGNFPGLKGGVAKIVVDSPDESRQVLINYITAKGTVNPSADNNWKFAPVGGKAVLQFNSSPDAKIYADASPNIKDAGANPDGSGFEQYTLDQNVHIQLLGINDFHGQLDTWRQIKDSSGKVVDYSGGIEYLAAYLKQREATNPANTLMVQAGDLVGASPPVSALMQDEPTIRMMNEIGIDVGTIGNHEFDEGVAEMKRLIYGGSNPKTEKYEAKYGKFTGANFPYVVANVVDEKTNQNILPPYVVKEVDGVKIGFIGVVTTETPTIVTPSGVAGVKFTDEVTAINKYAKELTDKGVKTIVVLAHDPGTSKTDGTAATGKVVDMAKAIDPSVDVIYGAHDHKYLNTTVDNKTLVQSWSYGTAFSDIDLTIDAVSGDIIDRKAEVVDTLHSKITADAKIKAELDGYQEDIKPIVSQVVGSISAPITNVANASGESALGNLIADGMRKVTGTELGFMNSGGIRNPLQGGPDGKITWGDLFKVQPFGNDLVTMTVTGDQIRTLLNQQFQAPPSYNKIMAVSGLRYTWTDSQPYGSKVLDIYLEDGSLIDPEAEYTITVNNFMADGGDGFSVLKSGKNRVTNVVDLDGFIQYFKSLPQPVSAQIEGRILIDNFVEEPQVSVTNYDDTLYGTTEPGAKVVAKVSGKVLGTATADDQGYFEIPMGQTFAKGTVIRLDITDRTGNLTPFDITVEAQTGWIYSQDEDGNDVWSYVDPETEELYTNKWLHDEDGLWYYFDNDGIMETGWVKVNGKWYFLSEDEETAGAMQTGWFKEGNIKYYLDAVNGDMKVNWAQINGKWYYFDIHGVMQTGWVLVNKKWYFLDTTTGIMKTGWVLSGKNWYYLANSGAMLTGWVQVSNKWYYLYNDGKMAANTTIGKYKLGKDGAWIK
ncbi:bifunctional 2',3'-cyclic-nucleotide 2'-phosphodiesterase/3'-nucleotidase [Paenibacillus sp. BSR1-1]|uniref:bifunctional 2',3'-cyclic-nucleotide 2'-phosphodiesterase/3'-nucleotidase n=1 Tax=Paenibacillus sp. BSR1-1 TaxID=3020845 RepID=UPI0025B2606E|nr:bifunctional 2',3'-cyclic-nucleotide 2'-phosphodiesterase/3'-nucleotidase [Paenibacillus sp. BSR1-1]MDN3019018.1 bifunctional 2',3'-cyclic-nucleotide 2'-phosphodiesterase/3'-nucleotidase [Paenibacillus sp. BSR1-1]